MPLSPDISFIPAASTGRARTPSHPSGGEGWGEGGCVSNRIQSIRQQSSPLSRLRFARHPLPLEGARVEVRPFSPKRDEDSPRDTLQIGHHLGIAETQNAIAARFKTARARNVGGRAVGVGVAVDLDHQPFRAGGEIGDIGRQHDLPLELDAKLPGTQYRPQRTLRRRHVGAELPCAQARFRVAFRQSGTFPLTPTPLPLKGERGSCRN